MWICEDPKNSGPGDHTQSTSLDLLLGQEPAVELADGASMGIGDPSQGAKIELTYRMNKQELID